LELSETFGKSVGAGIKGQSAAFAYDARETPQVFVDGLHIVPHANGTVAIGSTNEREFDDPSGVDGQCDDLIVKVIMALPVLADATVVDRWAGVRPRARSRAPMLGAWPDRVGHFIANGGFKIGFGMAPKVAEVMADLIIDGADRIPEGFRVEASL
jgi:glycine/D-amino acid oxidase-like deaminating enzyme